jgi:GPH family glycoside/pentoside/hexuronide:cation symporter
VPDAIEHGELQNGERQEGMFYSQITLAQKVASSIAVPLVLLVLQTSGYVANQSTQSESAIAGIRFVSGPVPAVTICLGILFTLLFPLGRDAHRDITRQLEIRRKAARGEPT